MRNRNVVSQFEAVFVYFGTEPSGSAVIVVARLKAGFRGGTFGTEPSGSAVFVYFGTEPLGSTLPENLYTST